MWNTNYATIHKFICQPLIFGFFLCYIQAPLDHLMIRYSDNALSILADNITRQLICLNLSIIFKCCKAKQVLRLQ